MKIFRGIVNSIVKLIAILIPVATAGAVIYNQFLVRTSVLESRQEVITAFANLDASNETVKNDILKAVDTVMNNGLSGSLELIIGLFGIIISVWVGLNIYNVMKKDDYAELLDTITEKCQEHDAIHNAVKKTNFDNMEMHLSYLYKTFDVNNNSSQYFYSMFKSIDTSKFDSDFLLNATFLETVYVKLTTLHDRNEHHKMQLYIEEGMRRCDEMLLWVNTNSDKKLPKNELLGYITYRYARMYFYQGMMQYYVYLDNAEATDNFIKAAKKFESVLQINPKILEEVDINNTLCYIYVKTYELNCNSRKSLYTKEDIDSFITTAAKYCESPNLKNHNSIKNKGIVDEKKGELDKAIENYEKAIRINPHDYKSRICLSSAYLKKAKKELGIENNRNVLLCNMSFNTCDFEKIFSHLENAEFELNIAYKIDAKSASYYYKMGELYTYRYLIESSEEERKNYSRFALHNFQISSSLKPVYDAHRFHERNYFEAIGNIYQASKINAKLDGLDVDHLQRLYDSIN